MRRNNKKILIVWMIVSMIVCSGGAVNATGISEKYILVNQSTNKKKEIESLKIGTTVFYDIEEILNELQFDVQVDKRNGILTAVTSNTKVVCKEGQKTIEVSQLNKSNQVDTIYYKTNEMVQVIQGRYMVPWYFFISSRLVGIFSVSKEMTGENKWGAKVSDQNIWEELSNEEILYNESIASSSDKVIVSVDPRIELLAVIEYLSGYGKNYKGTLTQDSTEYSQAIDLYFGKYKDHEAVQYFSELNKKKFIYDVPVEGMLYMNSLTKADYEATISERIKKTVGHQEYLEFLKKAKSFAEETNFQEFYNENKAFYQQIVEETIQIKPWNEEVQIYNKYMGLNENKYHIIISPLFIGGYGFEMEDIHTGNPTFYYIGGMKLSNDDYKKAFESVIEHIVLDRVVNKNLYETYNYVDKYNSIQTQMQKNKCYTWEECVTQHLIKAISIRNLELAGQKEAAMKLLEKEEKAGFIYLSKVCSKLEIYEKSRDTYDSIKEFYPILLEAFK